MCSGATTRSSARQANQRGCSPGKAGQRCIGPVVRSLAADKSVRGCPYCERGLVWRRRAILSVWRAVGVSSRCTRTGRPEGHIHVCTTRPRGKCEEKYRMCLSSAGRRFVATPEGDLLAATTPSSRCSGTAAATNNGARWASVCMRCGGTRGVSQNPRRNNICAQLEHGAAQGWHGAHGWRSCFATRAPRLIDAIRARLDITEKNARKMKCGAQPRLNALNAMP